MEPPILVAVEFCQTRLYHIRASTRPAADILPSTCRLQQAHVPKNVRQQPSCGICCKACGGICCWPAGRRRSSMLLLHFKCWHPSDRRGMLKTRVQLLQY